MSLNRILDCITNHIQSDIMYIEALEIDDVTELESHFYDFGMDMLNLLDESIRMELDGLDILSIVDSLSDSLKFNLVKHFIEEYDNEDDLNKNLVYYYIQYLFMLNITDMLLIEAYKDIIAVCKDIRRSLSERQEIDILAILKKNNLKLPTKDNPINNLEFNKGYLLCFMHIKLSYDEQFNVLNIVKDYSNEDWSNLLVSIYEEDLIRGSKWFIY